MRKSLLFLAAPAFLLAATERLKAQSPAPATLVKAARLLDPRTGNVLAPAAVLIDGNKVKEVGAPSQIE